MKYKLEEIDDLREVECFNENHSIYISLYPDSSEYHLPYFVVSDNSNEELSTKIARIRLDKPEYVYKENDNKMIWKLSKNEILEMISLLKSINYGYIDNSTYFNYIIDRYNGLCELIGSAELKCNEMPDYMELLNEK